MGRLSKVSTFYKSFSRAVSSCAWRLLHGLHCIRGDVTHVPLPTAPGTHTSASGEKFNGEYVDGVKHGFGIWTHPSGDGYVSTIRLPFNYNPFNYHSTTIHSLTTCHCHPAQCLPSRKYIVGAPSHSLLAWVCSAGLSSHSLTFKGGVRISVPQPTHTRSITAITLLTAAGHTRCVRVSVFLYLCSESVR